MEVRINTASPRVRAAVVAVTAVVVLVSAAVYRLEHTRTTWDRTSCYHHLMASSTTPVTPRLAYRYDIHLSRAVSAAALSCVASAADVHSDNARTDDRDGGAAADEDEHAHALQALADAWYRGSCFGSGAIGPAVHCEALLTIMSDAHARAHSGSGDAAAPSASATRDVFSVMCPPPPDAATAAATAAAASTNAARTSQSTRPFRCALPTASAAAHVRVWASLSACIAPLLLPTHAHAAPRADPHVPAPESRLWPLLHTEAERDLWSLTRDYFRRTDGFPAAKRSAHLWLEFLRQRNAALIQYPPRITAAVLVAFAPRPYAPVRAVTDTRPPPSVLPTAAATVVVTGGGSGGGGDRIPGVHAYLINLDRRPDRWVAFDAQWEALGLTEVLPYTRLSASDARTYTRRSPDVFRFEPYMNAAAVGCTLSHVRFWEQFLRDVTPGAARVSPAPSRDANGDHIGLRLPEGSATAAPDDAVGVVFEDDAVVLPFFARDLRLSLASVAQLDPDWELLWLGWHIKERHEVINSAVAMEVVRDPPVVMPYAWWMGPMGGTFGYAIRATAAHRLLKEFTTQFTRDKRTDLPVDYWMNHRPAVSGAPGQPPPPRAGDAPLGALRQYYLSHRIVHSDYVGFDGVGTSTDSDIQFKQSFIPP